MNRIVQYTRLKMTAKQTNEYAFTLVEILVVVLIIGILAAISIPVLFNQRQRANDATVESDVKNIAIGIDAELVTLPNGYVTEVESAYQSRIHVGVVKDDDDVLESDDGYYHFLQGGVTLSVERKDNAPGEYVISAWHQDGKDFTLESPLVFDSTDGYNL